MLSTDEFKNWAKGYVLFGHVTTQIEGRENDDLLGRKGGTGFPYVVAMSSDGMVLARLGARTVEGFGEMMNAASTYAALRAKADKSVDESVEVLVTDLQLGNVSPAEAQQQAEALGVTGERKQKLDVAIVDAEVMTVLRSIRSRDEFPAVAKRFYEMLKAGRKPGSMSAGRPFFQLAIQHAKSVKDVEAFAAALEGFEKHSAGNAQAKGWIDAQKKELEALRAAAEDADDEDDESDDDGMGDDGGE